MFRLGLEREMVEQGKDLLEEQERIKGELENRIQKEEQERKKEKEEIYKDFEQVYRSICIPPFLVHFNHSQWAWNVFTFLKTKRIILATLTQWVIIFYCCFSYDNCIILLHNHLENCEN